MSRSERFVYSKEAVERAEEHRRRQRERDATRMSSLATTLNRTKKAEIVGLIMQLADKTPDVAAWFEMQLNISKSKGDQIFDIERDIEIASFVPKHLINHNLPVDFEAYGRIEHGLQNLIEAGHLAFAMELAEKHMRTGSNQVEMSDEGLMVDAIVDCLCVVARAAKSAKITDEQRSRWMSAMTAGTAKVARIPCGTASTSIRRMTAVSAISDNAPPRGAGNNRSLSSTRGR